MHGGGRHAEDGGARRKERRMREWAHTTAFFIFRILVDKLLNGDWFYLDRLYSPDFLTAGPFFLPKFL